MIEHSSDITKLAAALHAAQGELEGVKKDARNPHFKNRYASLESVIDTAKPALQSHGLAFTQAPGSMVDGSVEITTMLLHTSGQWLRSTLHVPLAKRDPQGVGSATTYGCRYSLMAMLGLPPVDDDAEAAVGRSEGRQRPYQRDTDEIGPEDREAVNGNGSISARATAPRPPRADEMDESKAEYLKRATAVIQSADATLEGLREWWSSQKKARDAFRLSKLEVDMLLSAIESRFPKEAAE